MYFRELEWNYTAEVTSILFVVWSVGYIGANYETYTMYHALFVCFMFPASLVLVYVMENIFHID